MLEFAIWLPWNLSLLDILIVRYQSVNDVAFRDFNVWRTKVTCALYWLKENNCYYTNIIIDEEVLQSLPENSPIDDQLPQFKDVKAEDFDNDDDKPEDLIRSNFVPTPLPSPNKENAIADTLS